MEIKIAIDLANNQAVIASTFTMDSDFNAASPNVNQMDLNPAWIFDASTRFYFGGRGGDVRVSVMPKEIKVLSGFVPSSTTSSGTVYRGNLLLGHSRNI